MILSCFDHLITQLRRFFFWSESYNCLYETSQTELWSCYFSFFFPVLRRSESVLDRMKNWNKLFGGGKKKTSFLLCSSLFLPSYQKEENKEFSVVSPWPVTSQTHLLQVGAFQVQTGLGRRPGSSCPRCSKHQWHHHVQPIVFSGVRNHQFKAAEVKLISALDRQVMTENAPVHRSAADCWERPCCLPTACVTQMSDVSSSFSERADRQEIAHRKWGI